MVVAATGGHRQGCVDQRNHRSKHYGVVFVLELRIQLVSFFLVFSFPFINQMRLAMPWKGRCGTERVAVMLDIISFWEFAWMNYVCLMAFLYSSFTVEQPRGTFSWRFFFLGIFHHNIQPNISPTNVTSLFCFGILRKKKSLHLLAITAIIIMAFWEVSVVWGRIQ